MIPISKNSLPFHLPCVNKALIYIHGQLHKGLGMDKRLLTFTSFFNMSKTTKAAKIDMLFKTWKINELIFSMGKPFEIYFFPRRSFEIYIVIGGLRQKVPIDLSYTQDKKRAIYKELKGQILSWPS